MREQYIFSDPKTNRIMSSLLFASKSVQYFNLGSILYDINMAQSMIGDPNDSNLFYIDPGLQLMDQERFYPYLFEKVNISQNILCQSYKASNNVKLANIGKFGQTLRIEIAQYLASGIMEPYTMRSWREKVNLVKQYYDKGEIEYSTMRDLLFVLFVDERYFQDDENYSNVRGIFLGSVYGNFTEGTIEAIAKKINGIDELLLESAFMEEDEDAEHFENQLKENVGEDEIVTFFNSFEEEVRESLRVMDYKSKASVLFIHLNDLINNCTHSEKIYELNLIRTKLGYLMGSLPD